MAKAKRKPIGMNKIREMIRMRSKGKSAAETAFRLGIMQWNVYYLTKFIKVCVTMEEFQYMEEEAEERGFGTVGELVMDVFNRSYEPFYAKLSKRSRKKAS